MADEDLLVSISANISELLAGFNKASEEIADSLAQIQTHVGNASEALESKLSPAAEHAGESLHHIHEESEGLGGALEELKGKFEHALEVTGIAIALEMLERLKEKLDELSERAIEFSHMGESFDIGAVAMQGLEAAANETGISTSRLERTMFTLTQRLEAARTTGGDAAQKFNELGITNQMLADTSFNAVDAMEVLGRETNSNAELIGLLGARGAVVVPMLRELAEKHDLIAESAAKVNALLPSEISMMLSYHATVATVTEQIDNFASRLLIAAIPALQELVVEFEELTTVGPTATAFMDGLGTTIQLLVTGVTALAYGFKGAFDVIINGLRLIIDPFVAWNAALVQMVQGNFSGAKEILVQGFKNIGTNWHTMINDFSADADRGDAAVKRMWASVNGLSEVHPSIPREAMPENKPVPGDDTAYLNYLKDRIKIHSDMIKQEMKDDQEYLDAQVVAANNAAKAMLDVQLGTLAGQEIALEGRAKSEQFGYIRELSNFEQLIDDKLAAEIAFYDKEEALAAAAGKDTSKYEQDKAKATEAASVARVKAEQKAADQIRKTWDSVFKPIEASFTQNITKMIEGTEKFGEAWRNIAASILDAFIQMIVQMVARWLFGMLENLLISKTTAISQITANAGIAASAAMASVAAIPFYGWAMAPAVGASTFALAEGYAASVSAAGGYDIPAGMNPVGQLHAKEMVLPESIAEPLRNMIAGGGGARHVLKTTKVPGGHFVSEEDMVRYMKDANSRFAFGPPRFT